MLKQITEFDTVTKSSLQIITSFKPDDKMYRCWLIASTSSNQSRPTKSLHRHRSLFPSFIGQSKPPKIMSRAIFPARKTRRKFVTPTMVKGGEELLLVIEWPPPSRKILKFYVSSQCNNCWLPTSANKGSSKEIFLLFISVESLFFERGEWVVGQ